ncbi:MAG: lysine-sensitive aspartokinase 3 [Candidatus Xenobia bacterium]
MIVMKFGGTSVGSAERIAGVCDIVSAHRDRKPIVVVSALSGITDQLLRACQGALGGQDPSALAAAIRERHEKVCAELNVDVKPLTPLFGELEEILKGIFYVGEVTPRTRDRMASFGERLSSRIVASAMLVRGLPAVAHDAGDVGMLTSSDFTSARVLPEAEALMAKAFAHYDVVPVVTGFIGKDARGNITTLGRGGSDFSAALIGAALNVQEIQIWTDVSGIMTCDPRVVPEAKVLSRVTFDEAAELAYFGAKILHPRTIEPAVKKNIPVVVKNSFAPQDAGTTVVGQSGDAEGGVRAITSKSGVTTLNIYSTGMMEAPGFLAEIFKILQEHHLSVDVISTSEVNVSLTLDNNDRIEEALQAMAPTAHVNVQHERSIVCLVGEGIKTTPGVAARVFSVLAREGINIEMISQGASRINITFVVSDPDRKHAVKALHEEFFPSNAAAASRSPAAVSPTTGVPTAGAHTQG